MSHQKLIFGGVGPFESIDDAVAAIAIVIDCTNASMVE
jgi:hypothetical protein